ncbi:MAG: hypothetical protein WAU68_16890 [Vitreimonas sp.]
MKHSELAAKLVVDGCLAIIAGNVQGKMPMEGEAVTDLERAELGLRQGGRTVFYPLRESGVFLDLNSTTGSVFFADHDFDRAMPAIDSALKRAYPQAKQLKDSPHPRKKNFRFRSYEVDFGNGRLALVELDSPEASAKRRKFVARVFAHARKN